MIHLKRFCISAVPLLLAFAPAVAFSQQPTADNPPSVVAQPGSTDQEAEHTSKRIFWIIPNYRSSPSLTDYKPLTPKEKFTIAVKDSFDPGTFALAAVFAGEAQLSNSNKSFGQGGAGYGRYYGTSLADFVIGDFMTEAIYPTLLHQDPRYFRKGRGKGGSRLGYAVGQIVWTHTDSGQRQFNYSEILGNATSTAIGNAYYADNRDVADNVTKLCTQLAIDATSNILKEFWPDINRKFSRKHRTKAAE